MRALLIAACFLLACGGKEGKPIDNTPSGSAAKPGTAAPALPSLQDPFDKAMVDLEGFRARMCECKDVTCTDKVFAEFTTWRMDLRKTNNGKRPTKDRQRLIFALSKD